MSTYDEVPYDCHPIPGTAPEQLAVAAMFHGGPSPPAANVRYLEIGCGDGANLIPLAYHRPDCAFTGVDSSDVQIANASDSVSQLALENVTFRGTDIRTADDLPSFDYIVAHGVMSWVSTDVRDAIFRMCREHLTAHGVMYASFNTYPGWKVRGLVRDFLLRQTASASSLVSRAAAARDAAEHLGSKIHVLDHPYAQLLAKELHRVTESTDSYLIHEYLEGHNQPFWLSEFVNVAKGHGLRYVADAGYNQHDYRVPGPLQEIALELESERLHVDELVDLIWYRQHRLALFCRDDAETTTMPRTIPARATLACGLQPYSGHGLLGPDVSETYHGYFESDYRTELTDPLGKAALAVLYDRWPHGAPLETLFADASARLTQAGLPTPPREDRHRLEALLVDLHEGGQVDFRLRDSPAPVDASDRPVAGALTRWEAERRRGVTTAQHHRIGLSITERLLISCLDGTRDRNTIAHSVSERVRSGEVRGQAGEIVIGNAAQPGRIAQILDHLLAVLGAWGLLDR
jgi:SAM-dependent methyltransferase